MEVTIHLKTPHPKQAEFVHSDAKRIIIRAGRRFGKTTGIAIKAAEDFLKAKRVLYAAPTMEQIDRFWTEVTETFQPLVDAKVLKKNETTHTITVMKNLTIEDEHGNVVRNLNKNARIKAKTAWNADTLRGDFADTLILDEYQLMNEDAWEVVGAPMMLDTDGQAVFIYTPPSLLSSGTSRARDPRHAAKKFKQAQEEMKRAKEQGKKPQWLAITATSHDNPHISKEALRGVISDMSKRAYRQEILAEDDEGSDDWLVFKDFDESKCRISRFTIPQSWLIYVGHDFGLANSAALLFAQDPATGFLYAFHEYLPSGGSVAQHVEHLKSLTAGYNVVRRVGGSHQEEEVREAYRAHGWNITEPSIKSVNAQLDRVIGLMERDKVYVFSDMINYLDELMNCTWRLDDQLRPTDKIQNEPKYHLSACARYILSEFHPETAQRGPRVREHNFF